MKYFTFRPIVEFSVEAETEEEAREIFQRDLRELDKTGEWTGSEGTEVNVTPTLVCDMEVEEE